MRSYVINLDRAPERLAFMRSQFQRLGHHFERVAAVDAKLMGAAELDAFRDARGSDHRGHIWNPPQIGVFLSHIKTWRLIAAGSDPYAAIFEDDVHMSSAMAKLLTDSKWIPNTADIVRFETTGQSMRLARNPVACAEGINLFKVHSGAWGTAGYAIRKDISEWLAHSPPRIHVPVDWMLFHHSSPIATAITVLQMDPALCVQDQYHPDPASALNFDCETLSMAGPQGGIAQTVRRTLSPLVRAVTGRRGVRFTS
jgi:glycosyl transferase family 25